MTRIARRGYVEGVGLATVVLLGVGLWRAGTGAGSEALLASIAWLLASASIASGKVHIARRPARADRLWRASSALAVITAGLWGGPVGVALAAGGLAALVGYQIWYAQQDAPEGALVLGEPLPDFEFRDLAGTALSSAELRTAPHVLVFYRGSWCPFCVAQVGALAESYRELERRGVRVALISPQPARETRSLAETFNVAMDFYVDEAGKAASSLGIVQAGGVPLAFSAGTNGDTVVPSVVITDGEGTVIWVHHSTDHRSRPDPTTFLEVLDHGGVGAG